MVIEFFIRGSKVMNMLTKTTLAAIVLAITAVSANAQGLTRQIQVLPAPGIQAQAQIAAAPAQVEGQPAQVEAPAQEAAPVQEAAPQVAPQPEPKFAEPKFVEPKFIAPKPEPKFIQPKFVEKREHYGYRQSYASYGYKRAPHCH